MPIKLFCKRWHSCDDAGAAWAPQRWRAPRCRAAVTPFTMNPDTPETVSLVTRLRDGDPEALAKLFDQFRPQLRRMVDLRLDPRLGARVAPSDVLQEAYVDALTRYEHFFEREGMSFYVWLRLVVNQSLIDLHRRHLSTRMRDAGKEASLNWMHATSVSLARHLVAHMETPSQAMRHDEALSQVQSALDSLDPLDREILTLRHFEEL